MSRTRREEMRAKGIRENVEKTDLIGYLITKCNGRLLDFKVSDNDVECTCRGFASRFNWIQIPRDLIRF